MTRTLPATAAAALALAAAALPAAAQTTGLTLDQVEREYRQMSPVFIRKCDHDGNGLYDRAELQCVRGIYSVMYLER